MDQTLDDWVAFVTQLDPELPSRWQGGSSDEIDELEELVGSPLPAVYRDYLARAGRNNGGLRVFGDNDGSLRVLLTHYRAIKEYGWDVNPRYAITSLLGNRIMGAAIALENPPEPDGAIVLCAEGEVYPEFLIAENLRKLLFRSCFMQFRIECRSQTLFRICAAPTGTHAAIKETALRLGFQVHWFSDPVMLCAERGDVLLAAEELEQVCSLRLVADEEQAQEIGGVFQRAHGLQVVARQAGR